MQTTTRFMRLGLSAVAFVPFIAQAAPFEFDDADLLLAVQAVGGDGTTKNLFFNLGNTVTIKNSPNQGVVGDISADLEAAFGNNWWTRTDLYFGVFGNRSNLSSTTEPGNPPLVEPGRTIYVSSQTTAAGTAALRGQFGSSTLATGAGSYAGLRSVLTQADPGNPDDDFTATPSGSAILDQSTQPVSWNNSWSSKNPTPGTAFVIYANGIQNNFGQVASEVLVDVQRMTPSTPTTYVTTVGIDSGGQIRLFTGSANTPFQTWTLTFPALDTAAKRLPTADPDNDGLNNLMEFVLNGNPGVSDPAIAPDLDATGSNFVFTFNRRDDSEPGATLRFQYGTDLIGWTDATIGAGNSVVGNATIVVTENAANADAISVTVPKSVAPGGKLFGRLRYTQP